LKQVEFYFGDSNYPKDKFLRAQAAQDEEGYISLSTLMSFQRMKTLGATDAKELANILRKSELLQVKEDGTMVKRANPLPEEDKSNTRIVYSKGWPTGLTIEDVESVFSPHGKVLCVRIRRRPNKEQKDSVFTEMGSEEEARAIVAKGMLKFKDHNLTLMMKQDYFQKKKGELKDIRDEKKRKSEAVDEGEKKEEQQEPKKEQKKEFAKGTIVRFTGLGAEKVTREILKEIFGKYSDVAFADYSIGDTEGLIRAESPEGAQKMLKGMLDNKITIGGSVPELKLLEGEEETAYWEKVFKIQQEKKGKKGKGFKKGARNTKRRRF